MIKAAGFVSGVQVEQTAYNSSPITRGAMFTAVKPKEGEAAAPLTDEETALLEGGGSAVTEDRPAMPEGYLAKMGLRFTLYMILVGALLILSSGRPDWPNAWLFLAMSLFVLGANSYLMITHNPDLIVERMESLGKEDVKPWDKVFVPLLAGVGPAAVMLVSGLQARYVWPPSLPMWFSMVAMLSYLAANTLVMWAMYENRFFSAMVRIQKERGHKVVDTGPYAYVRHPGYAASLVLLPSMAVILGSTWGLVPAFITAALYVVRTSFEDHTLHEELEGYPGYAQRVKYRLVPGIW